MKNTGRDEFRQPRWKKLHLLKYGNIVKFLLYCQTYGVRAASRSALQKLHKPKAPLTPSINSLNLPDFLEVDIEEEPQTIDRKVSVVIPTRNAGAEFRYLLKKLKNQKGLRAIEIILVDSGSDDATLDIAGQEKVKVLEIPAEDFDHAYSRNKGAESAEGDYILFLAQDALPLTDRWIREMVAALEQNNLVAVSCAEYPRSDCDLFYQWTLRKHYKTLNLDRDRVLEWDCSCGTYLGLRANSQINNVAALFRKDIFLEYQFRSKYAEDLDLGVRLIKDKHRLGFLYTTRVLHSHNRSAVYFLKRAYVDARYLKSIFADFEFPLTDKPHSLFQDIFDLYHRTISVARYFTDMKDGTSGNPAVIRSLIRNHYLKECDDNETLDTPFADHSLGLFIQKLGTWDEDNSRHEKTGRNRLLPPFLNHLESFGEFISNTRNIVDDSLLREVGEGLHKMSASIIGAHLAYLFLTLSRPGSPDQFPAGLDDELCSGI